jgi:hypothetical protein
MAIYMAKIARGIDNVADSTLELFGFFDRLSLLKSFARPDTYSGGNNKDVPGNPPSAFRSQRRWVCTVIGSAVSVVEERP